MANDKAPAVSPLAIAGTLFFIFEFITWLNGTLISFIKLACELRYSQVLLVTCALYIAYAFLAISSSLILQKMGLKIGVALGLSMMAAGAPLFVPAAQAGSLVLSLIGLFVKGAGLAWLQTTSNPYASVPEPIESDTRRISIMGICNKEAARGLSLVIIGAVMSQYALSTI